MKSRRSKQELDFWYQSVRTDLSDDQLKFLRSRPSIIQRSGNTYAHGDPIDTVNGCLFPETVEDSAQMAKYFAELDGVFHCGHTHIRGVFSESNFQPSNQFDGKFFLNPDQSIINVGSVGQSRDGDLRACYVVSDGDAYEFIRVPYDHETTRKKLKILDPTGLTRS